MLNIFYGNMPEAVYNTAVYFKNAYEDEWITDPLSVDMIRDIDKSVVLGSAVIDSPVLGKIPPASLSGGVKTLIMLYEMDDFYTDLMVCGENCEKWISKISELKDITVSMSSYDLCFKNNAISGVCLNDGSTFNGSKDWIDKCVKFIDVSERGVKP